MPATAALSRLDRRAQYLRRRYSLPPRLPAASALFRRNSMMTAAYPATWQRSTGKGTLVAQSRRVPLWEVREGTCAPTTEAEDKAGTCAKRSYTEVLQKVPPHPESVCRNPWGLSSFLIFFFFPNHSSLQQNCYHSRAWRQGIGNATGHRSQQRESNAARENLSAKQTGQACQVRPLQGPSTKESSFCTENGVARRDK